MENLEAQGYHVNLKNICDKIRALITMVSQMG